MFGFFLYESLGLDSWKRAADSGQPEAMKLMAKVYADGNVLIPRDITQSLEYNLKLKDLESDLGIQMGIIFTLDFVLIFTWFFSPSISCAFSNFYFRSGRLFDAAALFSCSVSWYGYFCTVIAICLCLFSVI